MIRIQHIDPDLQKKLDDADRRHREMIAAIDRMEFACWVGLAVACAIAALWL